MTLGRDLKQAPARRLLLQELERYQRKPHYWEALYQVGHVFCGRLLLRWNLSWFARPDYSDDL